jgi:hypothetical protein
MSDQPITRVHYYDGQYLRLQDFTDEQAYHIGMRRRHNIGGHSWGIVRGLELALEDAGNGLGPYVGPGLAVDGYGRELILVKRLKLDLTQFDLNDSEILDVWLTYGRALDSPVAPGYGDCRSPGQDPDEFDRFLENPQPVYEAADLNSDRRHHRDIPDDDVAFGPERTPPDDAEVRWPVFVGRVFRQPKSPTSLAGYTYQVDPTGRPYAGLVGEWVVAPSGVAIVQLGAEPPPYGANPPPSTGAQPPATRRFAVFVRKDPDTLRAGTAKTKPKQSSRLEIGQNGVITQGKEPQAPRLEINDQGNMTLLGHTRLNGDLTIDGGGAAEFRADKPDPAAQPAASTSRGAGTQPPPAPPPWIIYKSVGPDPAPPDGQGTTTAGGGTAPAPPPPTGGTSTPPGNATTTPADAPATTGNGGTASPPPPTPPTVYDLRVVIDDDRLLPGKPTPASQTLPDAPNRFSVGSFSKDAKKFQPVLVVSNQGVTVYGDLVVKGKIRLDEEPVAGTPTPQAQALLTSAFTTGVTSGKAPLAGLDRTPLDGLALMMQTDAGKTAIKQFLDDRQLFQPFVALLLETPVGANAILRSFVP